MQQRWSAEELVARWTRSPAPARAKRGCGTRRDRAAGGKGAAVACLARELGEEARQILAESLKRAAPPAVGAEPTAIAMRVAAAMRVTLVPQGGCGFPEVRVRGTRPLDFSSPEYDA